MEALNEQSAAHEFVEVNEDDLQSVSGGCGTNPNPTYTCEICGNTFAGEAPHIFYRHATNTVQHDACESCYQAYKDDGDYDW